MLTVAQITTNIINQLKLLDPSASAEIGTPERKIIDATAEMIATTQVDFTVLSQQNNISTMTGATLDSYLGNFGFGRQQPTASSGVVTFSCSTVGGPAITIPSGTQVLATLSNALFQTLTFITLSTVVLDSNVLSVSTTAQCTTAGSVGNVAAGTISGFGGLKSIIGISGVTNPTAMTGGTDGETDSEYKTRFQNTIFRNMAGTYDQFMALAVSATSVTVANVVGPVSRYDEYLQIPSADDVAQETSYDPAGTLWPHKRTTVESGIPYSKYTYPTNYFLTNGTLDPATSLFYRAGADYIFNAPPMIANTGSTETVDSANPYNPNVTILATSNNGGNSALVPGSLILMEHAYMSKNSRNNYAFGILNCVDVFTNGENPTAVSSIEVVPPTTNELQNTNAALWTYQKLTSPLVVNFKRAIDGSNSVVGNLLQPCFWQPVVDLPDSITIGPNTYYQANYYNPSNSTYYNQYDGVSVYTVAAHYILTQEVNANFGTVRSRNSIEWFLSGNNYLSGALSTDNITTSTYSGALINTLTGTQFTLANYLYDQNVSDLQAIMEANKQVTTDILVHQAQVRYFCPIVTVMYTLGSNQAVVNAAIIATLGSYFNNQYFGAAIQMSDILQVIHNTAGVDNVRWTNPTGNLVQEVNQNGSSLATPTYWTSDFFLQDDQLAQSPNTNAVVITMRAQNTWGTLGP